VRAFEVRIGVSPLDPALEQTVSRLAVGEVQQGEWQPRQAARAEWRGDHQCTAMTIDAGHEGTPCLVAR
jgi:hypothetical protein